MRQLPILFSTPMVQAILENRKTMTRRTAGLDIMNENPEEWICIDTPNDSFNYSHHLKNKKIGKIHLSISRYAIGDHLWVKETYYASGYWVQSGAKTKTGKSKKEFVDNTLNVIDKTYLYQDNKPDQFRIDRETVRGGWFKRPSLFMPRIASRILLECTGVRCERLQTITEADAIAEGVIPKSDYKGEAYRLFINLWESINGKDSWLENPWVFVYEFKRIEKP